MSHHDDNPPTIPLPILDLDNPPATPGTAVATVEPLEGELLTEQESAALDRRIRSAVGRRIPRVDSLPVVRARAGARTLARHGFYISTGARHLASRWADRHGMARFERQMHAAEADRDHERMVDWREAAEQAKQARHDRMHAWMAVPERAVKAAAYAGVGLLGLLTVLGVLLAIERRDVAAFLMPFDALLWLINTLWMVVQVAGIVAVCGGPVVLLAAMWVHGRRHQPRTAPSWLATPAERQESFAIINEDMLTRALTHCKVTSLNQAVRAGEQIEFVVLPRQQGGGTYTQVRFPMGVTAADFLKPDQVERLAGNLGRHKHETYPQRQPDADARVLDLWIADRGTMDKPAPAWPLLHEGEFDVFRDRLPIGVTMRGEEVGQRMLSRHGLVGATSKQGKTATVRQWFLGLALDPTIELRISDLKGDGDVSMFKPRAHTLIEGSALEQTTATCVMLEDLVVEMMRRYDRKRELGIKGNITRELSRTPGSGFHPIYAWVDECQVLYAEEHPIGGSKDDARAWRAAKRLHDQARAVNIHLYQSTQRPDNRTLPVQVREGAHVRGALYVPNYETAKMVVADPADMGARPQDLRPGKDAGTIVLTGEVDDMPDGMAFLIVKSHYVATQDAYHVIDRAMTLLDQHGRTPTQESLDPSHAETEQLDPLVDIAAVLAEHGDTSGRMSTQKVIEALAARNPTAYGTWSFRDLGAALPEGTKKKTNGTMFVDAERLRQAITERNQNEGGGSDPEDPITEGRI